MESLVEATAVLASGRLRRRGSTNIRRATTLAETADATSAAYVLRLDVSRRAVARSHHGEAAGVGLHDRHAVAVAQLRLVGHEGRVVRRRGGRLAQ
eukprot:577724-Prymnesium_polylepis.1